MEHLLNKKEKKFLILIFLFLLFGVTMAFSTGFNEAFIMPKRFFLRTFTLILLVFWLNVILRKPSVEPETPSGSPPLVSFVYSLWRYLRRIPVSPVLVFALIYLAITLLSLLFSMNFISGVAYTFDRLCFVFIFILIISLFDPEDVRKCIPFLFIIGIFVAFYSIVQHLGVDPVKWSHADLVKNRSISTMGNPDFLSAFLVMLIPVAFCYAYRENSHFRGIPALLVWGILCLVNIATYSRAGLISMTAGTGVAVLLLGWKTLKRHWKKTIAVALILAIAFTGVLAMELSGKTRHSLVNRIKSVLSNKDINVLTRFYLWTVGLKVIKKYPLLGSGPMTFSISYLPFRGLEPGNIRARIAMPESTHNLFLDTAVFSGVFAMLSLLLMIFFVFYRGIRCFIGKKSREEISEVTPKDGKDKSTGRGKNSSKNDEEETVEPIKTWEKMGRCPLTGDNRVLAAGFLSALAAFVVHHLAGFPTYPDELLFWIFLGFCTLYFFGRIGKPVKTGEQNMALWKAIFIAVVGAIAVFLIYQSGQIAMADYSFARAEAFREAIYEIKVYKYQEDFFKKAKKDFEDATDLNPWNPRYWQSRGKLFEQFYYINKDKSRALPLAKKAIESYEMAIMRNPYNPYSHADLARFCSRVGVLDLAEKEYLAALKLDPSNIRIMTDLAVLYKREEKYDQAEKLFKHVIELYPHDYWPFGSLGLFYYDRGMYKEAREYLEKALKMLPLRFTTDDIADWTAVLITFSNPDRPEEKYILGRMAPKTRELLNNWRPGKPVYSQYREALVAEFNKIVKDRNFYDPEVFKKVKLTEEGKELKKKGMQNLTQEEVRRFNRLLFLSLYSHGLSRSLDLHRIYLDRLKKMNARKSGTKK